MIANNGTSIGHAAGVTSEFSAPAEVTGDTRLEPTSAIAGEAPTGRRGKPRDDDDQSPASSSPSDSHGTSDAHASTDDHHAARRLVGDDDHDRGRHVDVG